MHLFLTIAGGVALILFGVRFLRKGLDRLFGPKLATVMQRLTRSPVHAVLTGLGISLAAPSSTTISILTVQAVQAGHLSCRRTLPVMLGANVGLTVMVLLIALRLEQYAPILILVGVVLFQFTRPSRSRGIGQVTLSLGLIFTAIGIIKSAGSVFDPEGDFIRLLDIASHYPFWIAIIAAILTVLLQSSTAAIALIIGLSTAGAVSLPLALAVVVGANVGLGLSTLLVGWTQVASRRLAIGNLLSKVIVAVPCIIVLPLAVDLIEQLPLGVDKQIAISHAAFNIIVLLLFLPLITPLYALTVRLAPDRPESQTEEFGPRYITREPIEGLTLATGQSTREVLRVSEIVRQMLADLRRALEQQDVDLARSVQQRDNEVDLLDREIKQFLTRVSVREGEQDEDGEVMRQLRFLSELETIGDIIDKNLAEVVIKRIKQRIDFPRQDWEELKDFYGKVSENLLIAEIAFTTRDRELADKLLRHKERLNDYERELRDRHFNRLRSDLPQSHEASAIHLDMLTHLKRINSSVTHVAYAIIQGE